MDLKHVTNENAKPLPKLPESNAGILQAFSEHFAFHSSPEQFIASRAIQLARQQPDPPAHGIVLRARMLNRNVAIVTGYDQIRQVLEREDEDENPKYAAASAYDVLTSSFFPGPNLLVSDGCPHRKMRALWDEEMRVCYFHRWSARIQEVVDEFYDRDFDRSTPDSSSSTASFDLYKKMKTFSWRILLKCFLNLDLEDHLFAQVQDLQENLLRGQLSLMSISINTGFWKSARTKGIEARLMLQDLIAQRLREIVESDGGGSIEAQDGAADLNRVNHVLMMTSSLAVKGMASLMTAFLLNIFLLKESGTLICDLISQVGHGSYQLEFIRSVYFETERLSPPFVGAMRRSAANNVLPSTDTNVADTLIPKDWDVWLYFVGGSRDPGAFGDDSDIFDPTRYLQHEISEPLAFGLGSKTCPGRQLVRETALMFVQKCLSERCRMECDDLSPGVQGWLGWIAASPDQWASDMKQLPTQHPSRPILVQIVK